MSNRPKRCPHCGNTRRDCYCWKCARCRTRNPLEQDDCHRCGHVPGHVFRPWRPVRAVYP